MMRISPSSFYYLWLSLFYDSFYFIFCFIYTILIFHIRYVITKTKLLKSVKCLLFLYLTHYFIYFRLKVLIKVYFLYVCLFGFFCKSFGSTRLFTALCLTYTNTILLWDIFKCYFCTCALYIMSYRRSGNCFLYKIILLKQSITQMLFTFCFGSLI